MEHHHLLHPGSGKPMLALGGEHAYKQFVKGDINVSLQWVHDEPCIVLFAVYGGAVKKGAFCIALSALHRYVDSNGYPTGYGARASIDIATQLGFTPGKDICFRITEAILDAAEDLVRMPPTPQEVRDAHKPEPVGELSIKVGGRLVREMAV